MKLHCFRILLATGLFLPACKPQPDPVARALTKGGDWQRQFAALYPKPLGALKEAPHPGRTGDITVTNAFTFILADFPKENFSELETWIRQKMKEDAIVRVAGYALFPDNLSSGHDFVRSETIILHADGRREVNVAAKPDPLSFGGKEIPRQPPR